MGSALHPFREESLGFSAAVNADSSGGSSIGAKADSGSISVSHAPTARSHSFFIAISLVSSARWIAIRHSEERGLAMTLNKDQFRRQMDFCAVMNVLSALRNTGVISEEDFMKAQNLMAEKYRPIIRLIS